MVKAILDMLGLSGRSMEKDPKVALAYRIFGPDGRDETDELRARLRAARQSSETAPAENLVRVCADGDPGSTSSGDGQRCSATRRPSST
ncbi:MAG: hypothetical protein HPM95_00560 [Alphaproteobacteria bacterium]|nr:hypothetical protein [Alphaproteobacteria bacterium]